MKLDFIVLIILTDIIWYVWLFSLMVYGLKKKMNRGINSTMIDNICRIDMDFSRFEVRAYDIWSYATSRN